MGSCLFINLQRINLTINHGFISPSPYIDKEIERKVVVIAIFLFYWTRHDFGAFVGCLSWTHVQHRQHSQWHVHVS